MIVLRLCCWFCGFVVLYFDAFVSYFSVWVALKVSF